LKDAVVKTDQPLFANQPVFTLLGAFVITVVMLEKSREFVASTFLMDNSW
jgi:hypothetical protein